MTHLPHSRVDDVADTKGKGKSTDPTPAAAESKDDEDDDDEEEEPVIMTGRRKRTQVNYADVSFISLLSESNHGS